MAYKNYIITETGSLFPCKKILLITPVLKEFHAAREVFGAVELPPPDKGRLAEKISTGRNIRILQTGMGSAAASPYRDQLEQFKPDLVIDSGSCGSLSADLAPQMILMAEEVLHTSGSTLRCPLSVMNEYLPANCMKSRMVEVDEPLVNAELRNSIREKTAADACSMETFLVAEGADENNTGWLSLRIVTDYSNERTSGDFKKNIRQSSLLLYGEIFKILDLHS